MDKVTPRCETGQGCLLPTLGPDEVKALEMRSMLMRLEPLASTDTVLRLMGATRRHLKLMAAAEDAIKEMREDAEPAH